MINPENIKKKEISIYDKGELLCSIVDEQEIYPRNTVMSLFVIKLEGEEYDVLHIRDMDYGIVIPSDIAKKMNGILEKEIKKETCEHVTLADGVCFKCGKDILNNKMEEVDVNTTY